MIDQKGRVSIPAKFRELILHLGRAELIVTRSTSHSLPRLDAYPMGEWESLEERTRNLPRFDPAVTFFKDFYLGNAHTCDIDSQGRVLVPPRLRDWAMLTKEIVFTGAGEHFRIQAAAVWQQIQSENSARVLAGADALLGKLNL